MAKVVKKGEKIRIKEAKVMKCREVMESGSPKEVAKVSRGPKVQRDHSNTISVTIKEVRDLF